MPTPTATAIRQQRARARILSAAETLAEMAGVDLPDLTPRSRDTGTALAMQLEAFATLIEEVNAALAKQRAAALKAQRAAKKATEPDAEIAADDD